MVIYHLGLFIVMSVHLDHFSGAAAGYKFFMNVFQDLFFAFREFTMVNEVYVNNLQW